MAMMIERMRRQEAHPIPFPSTYYHKNDTDFVIRQQSFFWARKMSLWSRATAMRCMASAASWRAATRHTNLVTSRATQRTFSKESSASDLHSQVAQTLRAPPTEALLDPNAPRGVAQQIFQHPDRRARYNQSLWNAGAAFMLMLLAAQSLKASRERRRLAQELTAAQAESAERLALLQVLFADDTVESLVQDLMQVHAQAAQPIFPILVRQSSTEASVLAEKKRLAHLLLQHFSQLVGSVALDEAQREALRMRLAQDKPPGADSPGELPETEPEGASEPTKRVPFTM